MLMVLNIIYTHVTIVIWLIIIHATYHHTCYIYWVLYIIAFYNAHPLLPAFHRSVSLATVGNKSHIEN